MTDASLVTITVGSGEEALTIARTLVAERLVACVQIISRIRSIYRWKGEVCDEEEQLLLLKTRSDLFPALRKRICELHSYEVPEIVSFPITVGLSEYLAWVVENTQPLEPVPIASS